jgi:hypothetical protein
MRPARPRKRGPGLAGGFHAPVNAVMARRKAWRLRKKTQNRTDVAPTGAPSPRPRGEAGTNLGRKTRREIEWPCPLCRPVRAMTGRKC